MFRLAQRFLIAVVFAVATAGGVMSKSGNLGGTVDVVAGLTAFGLGLICAFCGARLAYLNAEQEMCIRDRAKSPCPFSPVG